MWMFYLPMWLSTPCLQNPQKPKWEPWDWSYRQLCIALWVLEIELGPLEETSVLKCWAVAHYTTTTNNNNCSYKDISLPLVSFGPEKSNFSGLTHMYRIIKIIFIWLLWDMNGTKMWTRYFTSAELLTHLVLYPKSFLLGLPAGNH